MNLPAQPGFPPHFMSTPDGLSFEGKERPGLKTLEDTHKMAPIAPPAGVLEIITKLNAAGRNALLAGGCVRDALLGHEPKDWDIATDAEAGEVMALFERTVAVGFRFGVVRVLTDEGEYEVARFRREDAYLDGRHPSAVYPASAEEDAKRRDFTINGMFYDVGQDLFRDFVGGREDLEKGLIRAIGEPEERFRDDHLRMLRAVRFAARFSFEIEQKTYAAVQALAPLISKTSAERVCEELTLMLTGRHPERAFELLYSSGLLAEVLPEVVAMKGVDQPPQFHPEGDVWTHVLRMLAHLEAPSPTLAWGVLLHDIGKPGTYQVTDRIRFNGHAAKGAGMAEAICERLMMPKKQAARICDLVANHMRFMNVRQMQPARLKRFLREPYFDELLELHRIDNFTSGGKLITHRFCVEKLESISDEGLWPAQFLDGHDLMAMGFEEGPQIQEIMTALEEEQLEGRVGSRGEAERFVSEKYGPQKS